MTLPMGLQEKIDSKEAILDDVYKMHQMTNIIRDCLRLSDKDDFNSDYIVIAKNMAMDICEVIQGIDHRLHELKDAPLINHQNGTSVTG